MRIPRIFIERDLRPGSAAELDERAMRYVSQVLRLRPGQSIVLFNGDGIDVEAVLTRCDRKACVAQLGQAQPAEPPAALQIHLGVGISRGERMDFAIQKSVELGVFAITPLLTERGVVQLRAERQAKRMAHWQGVLVSACEQSGRSRMPTLHPSATLGDWLATQRDGLMLYHRAADTLASVPHPGSSLKLLVGPEGGLSEEERAMALASGFRGVRLGPRVLRTETAPLAAIAAIQALWGDFR